MIRMKYPFHKTSLKTVIQDTNRNSFKIENIDSTLVKDSLRLLTDIYLNSTSKIIPFFRGFSPEYDTDTQTDLEMNTAYFFYMFFIVGEKGKAYREKVLHDGITYFHHTNEYDIDNDINVSLDFINAHLKRNNFGNIDKNELLVQFNEDKLTAYMFILNISHNIGGRWSDKSRSPFVSAAYGIEGLDKALYFAKHNNSTDYSYVIFSYIKKSDENNYVLTKDILTRLTTLKTKWYQDIHSEIILKDGIFPNNILGVFRINNSDDSKEFIINPSLYQLLLSNKKRKRSIDKLVLRDYILQNGIPIDQNNFELYAQNLNYNSYGYRSTNGTTLGGELGHIANLDLPGNKHNN